MDDFLANTSMKKVVISVIVTLLVAFGSGLTGWTYSQVRDLPINYVPRPEIASALERINLDMKEAIIEARNETRRETQKMREDLQCLNARLDALITLLMQKSNVATKQDG
jgi:hypothetical protein